MENINIYYFLKTTNKQKKHRNKNAMAIERKNHNNIEKSHFKTKKRSRDEPKNKQPHLNDS